MTPGGGRRLGLPNCRHAGIQRGTDPHRTRSLHCLTNVGDAGISEGFTPGGEVKRREPIKQPINQKIVQTQATQTPPCRNASAPKREPDPPQGQDPALPEQEPETWGPSRSRHPPSCRTLTMPRASEGPERRLTHHRDRTLHCPSRNLRLGAQKDQIPPLRRTPTIPRASEGPESRLLPPTHAGP